MFCFNLRVSLPNIYLSHNKIVRISKRCTSHVKYTAHLQTDIEEQIKSGALTPKKNPGRRKIGCVTLPDELIKAAENVTTDLNQGMLMDAKELNIQLNSRRPPIEKEEYMTRSQNLFAKLSEGKAGDSVEEMIDIANKTKKKLQCEVKRWKNIEYDKHTCRLYLIARLAANYAVITWVLSEIKCSIPSFAPRTFFDFGSGVGSSIWSARSIWGKEIEEYFCVDASPHMNDLAELLIKGEESEEEKENEFLKKTLFRQFLPTSNLVKYDLVVSAFSLLELPSMKERMRVIDILWQKTQDTLVLIEQGSFAGYSMIMDARDYILQMGNAERKKGASCSSDAYVVAPCPHDMTCPIMQAGKRIPCNFEVSYHPLFLGKGQAARKEQFSFVVIRKNQTRMGVEQWPRIVQQVGKRRGCVHCHLCCSDGQFHEIIFTKSKHSREMYQCARASSLGDLLPVSVSTVTENPSLLHITEDLEELESDSDSESHVLSK